MATQSIKIFISGTDVVTHNDRSHIPAWSSGSVTNFDNEIGWTTNVDIPIFENDKYWISNLSVQWGGASLSSIDNFSTLIEHNSEIVVETMIQGNFTIGLKNQYSLQFGEHSNHRLDLSQHYFSFFWVFQGVHTYSYLSP